MEMKKINDNTIKVLLENEDLVERGITVLDLLGNQKEIESFFYSILDEVDVDHEFRDNEAVTFQMMPNRNGLELFISKVDPSGESEPFNPLAELEKQGKKVHHVDMTNFDEDDNLTDFLKQQLGDAFEKASQDQEKVNNETMNSKGRMTSLVDEEKSYLVELDDFEDFLNLVNVLEGDEITSDLYFLHDKYYLKLTFYPDSISEEQINDLMAVAYEYGRRVDQSPLYVQEHGKQIMEHAALEIAQHYFNEKGA
ncbi:adaptor protein MecA [Ligilactobacillus equi]|nr:adaptor protein MecA [Ligilactobacillus equi]